MQMIYETYLSHHGILGMKWGVRRYQNKDGTLTAAGRKHYAKVAQSDKRPEIKRNAADEIERMMRSKDWLVEAGHEVAFETTQLSTKHYMKKDKKTGIEYVDRNDIDDYASEIEKIRKQLQTRLEIRLNDNQMDKYYDVGTYAVDQVRGNGFGHMNWTVFPKGGTPWFGSRLPSSPEEYKKKLINNVKDSVMDRWLKKNVSDPDDYDTLYDCHLGLEDNPSKEDRRSYLSDAKDVLKKYDLTIDDWLSSDRAVDDYYSKKKVKHSSEGGTNFKMDKKYLELSEVVASLDPNYLAHHGIKGQKWGVEHGPPYPLKVGVSARIKRAAKSVKNRVEANRQQKAAKREAKEAARRQKKPTLQDKIDAMTNEQLDAVTNRLKKENAYLDELGKKQAKKGESFLKKSADLLNDLKTAGDALSGFIQTGKKLKKAMGLSDDNESFDSFDWKNWRKKKPNETEEQYSKRLSALSNIRQRQIEFEKVEEKERQKKS